MIDPLPLPRVLTPNVEYHVVHALVIRMAKIVDRDGTLREYKAEFDNGAVLRMTAARIAEPEAGETSAGPFPT